jgi:hypothetical protein
MNNEMFYHLVSQAGNEVGRSVEMMLFGDTSLYHICTCYVTDLAARFSIRYDVAVHGLSYEQIVNKYGEWIDSRAPIMSK